MRGVCGVRVGGGVLVVCVCVCVWVCALPCHGSFTIIALCLSLVFHVDLLIFVSVMWYLYLYCRTGIVAVFVLLRDFDFYVWY